MWKKFDTETEKVIKELQDNKFYLENSSEAEYYLEAKHKKLFEEIQQLHKKDQQKIYMKISIKAMDPEDDCYKTLNEHLQEYLDHKINYQESEQPRKKGPIDPSELSPLGQEILASLKQDFKNIRPEDITTIEELNQLVKDYKQDHKKEFMEKLKSFEDK